jgi:hypothetical protein
VITLPWPTQSRSAGRRQGRKTLELTSAAHLSAAAAFANRGTWVYLIAHATHDERWERVMSRRRILVFGDSHTQALQHAHKKRASSGNFDISALLLARLKNGKEFGDISLDAAASMAAESSPDDLVVSTIGGNLHQVFGLVQHPTAFDFIEPGSPSSPDSQPCVLIPYQTIWAVFEGRLRQKDGHKIATLREAAARPIYHLLPPPPKESTAHILQRYESAFEQAGIAAKGVTPAPIRLKLWRLQCAVLRSLCTEWGVRLLPPPEGTQTPEGFLKPEYYKNDATHANPAYGELALRQLEAVAAAISPAEETALRRSS